MLVSFLCYLRQFSQTSFTASANEINDDFKNIEAWDHQWKMSFQSNPLKEAQEVIFSLKKIKTPSSQYYLQQKSSKNKNVVVFLN